MCLAQLDTEYHIEMWESTPYVELLFEMTVPLACDGCSAIISLKKHVGLTVSNCSVVFSSTDPPFTNHSLRVRAVQTPGTKSRIVKLEFNDVVTDSDSLSWNDYKIPALIVSRSYVKPLGA